MPHTIDQLREQESEAIYHQLEDMILNKTDYNAPLSTYEIMLRLKDVIMVSPESWSMVAKQLHKLREERKINGKLMPYGRRGEHGWVWWKNLD